jgi:hypothetical protein
VGKQNLNLKTNIIFVLCREAYFYGAFYNGSACSSSLDPQGDGIDSSNDIVALFGKQTNICAYDRARSDVFGATVYSKYTCESGKMNIMDD